MNNQILIEQLGGLGRLRVMISAYNFIRNDENHYLSFKFRGCRKLNYVKISLRHNLYDLEFCQVTHDYRLKNKRDVIGVYAGEIRKAFSAMTQLDLHCTYKH